MSGGHPAAPDGDVLAFCSRMGALEGRLARPFSNARVLLQSEGLEESSLAVRRAELATLISAPEAAQLRAAFAAAYDRARTAPPPALAAHEQSPAPPRSVVAPVVEDPPAPPLATPSFMQAAPPAPAPAAVSPPPVAPSPPAPDETAFLRLVPAGPTLPFVPGDAKAFVAAALASKEEADENAVVSGDEATTAASGDETQALDFRKLLEEVHPFEREVERSLPAFVDLLVALTQGAGREDEVGARFGVPTAAEREQVLAAWRKRWDAEPAVRAEWQRLYAERVRR